MTHLVDDGQKRNRNSQSCAADQDHMKQIVRKNRENQMIFRSSVEENNRENICTAVGNGSEKKGQKARSQKGQHKIDDTQKSERNQTVGAEICGDQRIGPAVDECTHRAENRIQKRPFLKVQKREDTDTDGSNHHQCTERGHEDVRFAIPSHAIMIAF